MKDKDFALPIEFDGWDSSDIYGDVQFYCVTFLEDFGIFKKGDQYDCLAVVSVFSENNSNNLRRLEVYDDLGKVVKYQNIKYTPV